MALRQREVFAKRIPLYRKDPCLFFKEVTGFKPDPWQKEAATAIAQHRKVSINDISTGYVSVHQYAGIPNVAGSTAYTSNWVAELFGPSNLKKSTSGFPQRLYNSVLQGALGIDKDGIFGANTEKTVKEFQSAHGLTADGIAGAKTKAALAKQL